MDAQLSEETSCERRTADEAETSNLTPHEIAVASNDATTGGAILQVLSTQEHDSGKRNCACTDETKTETESATSLDREGLSLKNSTAELHERPGANEHCSVEIPTRTESDKKCENACVKSTTFDLEETSTPSDTLLNMADDQPGTCIEMGDITKSNDTESTICDDKSTCEIQRNGTTVIYIAEGDNSELETDVCRICHCGEEAEAPLISPCLCTGSVKFVHHKCLMSWLQRAVMSKCELCLYPLAVRRKRKPLKKWRLPEDKPFPILWLFTFVVAMTLNIASITKDGSQRCVSDPCIIFYVLGSAGALLGLAFFYHWLRKTVRYFAKWIALNQEWTLVGPENLRTQLGETNLAYSSKSLSDTGVTQEQIA